MNNSLPYKILVYDDDPAILDVITIVLEEEGYRVFQRLTAKLYKKDIEEIAPDLLLVDIWMPDVSGDTLTRWIKNNQETTSIPVLLISASRDTESIAKETGADGYLYKPFDITDLSIAVSTQLKKTNIS